MKLRFFLFFLSIGSSSFSQENIDQLLEAGLEDASRFSKDYFQAGAESLVSNLSNGWYTTAKIKRLFDIEVGVVGAVSFVRDDKKVFQLNENDYNNISFRNGTTSQLVSNIFGINPTDVTIVIRDGLEITLPNGLNGAEVNNIPNVFLQGSMGLVESTEVKVRFMPKIEVADNTKVGLWGLAFQHELTSSIYAMRRLPFSISGILGYTRVSATYDFSENSALEGNDQELKIRTNSWLLSGIISTKMELLNFYGGFGYFSGSSDTAFLGTYKVLTGSLSESEITDPISVLHKESGLKATLGTSFTYSIVKANIDYSLQNFNTISFGLNFNW